MLPVLFGENLFDDFFDDSFEREFRALNTTPCMASMAAI